MTLNQETFYVAIRVASVDLALEEGLLKAGTEYVSTRTFSNSREAAIRKANEVSSSISTIVRIAKVKIEEINE